MSGVAAPQISNAHADRVLNAVLARLQIVLTSAAHVEPGRPLTAAVVPASPEIDASELADGLLNLAWTAKDLLFPDDNAVPLPDVGTLNGDTFEGDDLAADVANVTGVLGQPFPPPLPGGASLNKTPGMLAQLFGTFAVPRLKVGFRIRWIVRDQEGHELGEGEDFIATQGLTSPAVSLLLPPIFRELRLDSLLNPGGSVVCLSAEVTLSLGARTLVSTLGPVPVVLLPLLIPTVVVLFSEPSFGLTHDSSALIIVPKHSPFSSAEPLFKTLKKIESVVSALRSIGGLASFFLGLDELLGTVPEQPRLRFAAADEIRKLGDIKIKRRPWYQFLGEDPNWDDRAFSLIVFGLPGTRVEFFNDTSFDLSDNQGSFEIQLLNQPLAVPPLLDFFVAVRTLDTDDDVEPETLPPHSAAAPRVPGFTPDLHGDDLWHTDMSSVRFHKDFLGMVAEDIANPPIPQLVCARPVPIGEGAPKKKKHLWARLLGKK
jgi:hypothetical protein